MCSLFASFAFRFQFEMLSIVADCVRPQLTNNWIIIILTIFTNKMPAINSAEAIKSNMDSMT